MARTRRPVPRVKRPSTSQISEALGNTLNQEFEDHVTIGVFAHDPSVTL